MAKEKFELSTIDKIKASTNYKDFIFISINDLIGNTEGLKPTDIFVFPPYRDDSDDSKTKHLYNDIDYDSDDFERLKKLDGDLSIDISVVKHNLEKQYFNQEIINEKPKYSVTEIKQRKSIDIKNLAKYKSMIQESTDTEDMSLVEERTTNYERVDGSELGNMIHSFMERYDFESEIDLPSNYIENIKNFLESDLGKALTKAKNDTKLYREQRFMIELPLDTVKQYMGLEALSNPYVIVQGVIDAFYINDNGNIVLIDYKTDGLSTGKITKEQFMNNYKIQMDIYAKALSQITGKTVEKKYIYSFALNEAISI